MKSILCLFVVFGSLTNIAGESSGISMADNIARNRKFCLPGEVLVNNDFNERNLTVLSKCKSVKTDKVKEYTYKAIKGKNLLRGLKVGQMEVNNIDYDIKTRIKKFEFIQNGARGKCQVIHQDTNPSVVFAKKNPDECKEVYRYVMGHIELASYPKPIDKDGKLGEKNNLKENEILKTPRNTAGELDFIQGQEKETSSSSAKGM